MSYENVSDVSFYQKLARFNISICLINFFEWKKDRFRLYFFQVFLHSKSAHRSLDYFLSLSLSNKYLYFLKFTDAGISSSKYRGSKTGVFVGLMSNDYLLLQQDRERTINAYTSTSTSFCIAANRISYLLDLRGPSMTIDTACSSSLTAVHLAINSLRSQETDMFLCGGANALLSPNTFVSLSQVNFHL